MPSSVCDAALLALLALRLTAAQDLECWMSACDGDRYPVMSRARCEGLVGRSGRRDSRKAGPVADARLGLCTVRMQTQTDGVTLAV